MSKLKEFLKEDLTELYINVNELVDNLYVRGQEDNFKDEIESDDDIIELDTVDDKSSRYTYGTPDADRPFNMSEWLDTE